MRPQREKREDASGGSKHPRARERMRWGAGKSEEQALATRVRWWAAKQQGERRCVTHSDASMDGSWRLATHAGRKLERIGSSWALPDRRCNMGPRPQDYRSRNESLRWLCRAQASIGAGLSSERRARRIMLSSLVPAARG